LKNNEIFEIKATHGPPVGAIEAVSYKTGKMTVGNGDRIILYTDGVTDAENNKAEFYGKDRMEAIINKNMTKSIGDITSALIKDLKKYSGKSQQSDDITILALEFRHGEKSGKS
jgi:serine phosphatase RsbU (regulator of sigma subunit)